MIIVVMPLIAIATSLAVAVTTMNPALAIVCYVLAIWTMAAGSFLMDYYHEQRTRS